jgi:hypothetical protein
VHTPPAECTIQFSANNEKKHENVRTAFIASTTVTLHLIMLTYLAVIDNLRSKNPRTSVLPYLLDESKCTENCIRQHNLKFLLMFIKQNITVHIYETVDKTGCSNY